MTEDTQEIKIPEREWLDILISREPSKPRLAGPDDDTQIIDLSDTGILNNILSLPKKVIAELNHESKKKVLEIRATREEEKQLKLRQEAIKTYLRAIGTEEAYEAFNKVDNYEK